jgi:hypothetical protein
MLTDAALKKKYGITKEQHDELLRNQGGVCAICKCHQRYQSLAVDHDHKTGHVRGLLCMQCNRGLGRFFDSPLRLRNAADYIEASRRGRMSAEPSTAVKQHTHSAPATSPILEVNKCEA